MFLTIALAGGLIVVSCIAIHLGNEYQKLNGEYIRTRNKLKKLELDYEEHMRDVHHTTLPS